MHVHMCVMVHVYTCIHAVRLLEGNAAVHEAISTLSLPTVDVFTIPKTESGTYNIS